MNNSTTRIVIAIDIPTANITLFENDMGTLVSSNFLDSFYFLTASEMRGENTVAEPIIHKDQHLEPENRLAKSFAAIQNGAFTVVTE